MTRATPAGDHAVRSVCPACGFVDYANPKVVAGCVVEHEGSVLLCRRAIEPCRGLWTLPAGFLELGESAAEGAARETWEEATARVQVLAPYAHLDVPRIGQIYVLFRAALLPPFTFAPGAESLEVRLFAPHEIPYAELAFSTVSTTLRLWTEDLAAGGWCVHSGVIEKEAGSGPNGGFRLRDHIRLPLQRPGPQV